VNRGARNPAQMLFQHPNRPPEGKHTFKFQMDFGQGLGPGLNMVLRSTSFGCNLRQRTAQTFWIEFGPWTEHGAKKHLF